MSIPRRTILALAAAASPLAAALAQGTMPKLERKANYRVGFAQTESNNPWRIAQTESMRSEAQKRGDQFVYTDAAASAAKQVSDVNSMIAQKVDLIFLAPREERPLVPAVMAAKRAGIPVILLDRRVDAGQAQAGRDYVTFIGSDFVDQGRRAAEWLDKAVSGKARIIELQGTTGSSPANDRRKGFVDYIAKRSDMKVIASQSGDFVRDKGRQVAEALLQAHPDATAIYAHNDEMAIGAIAALEARGRKPGQDVIIASIDGTRSALQAIIDGKMGATVESNPRFGPKAFETLDRYARGETIDQWVVVPDRFFDRENAQQFLADAY
ncbi:MAG: Ribose ABC transport system, periplasmic ribose-binding protein RbsB [uncultured Craurococcus sp.]|uniref:Ribose ABC transport system, periplasmic ribose-binding protein RbsB n=1 Tax=uncultured Craurococcus sp. TaxID=1135998 RepID=A0A6J4IF88_9PROT|nr:MAG: Ribose ABC transport system, periplasmic ribose-binding protein RbsB [uncultured Craurococcus sp.]